MLIQNKETNDITQSFWILLKKTRENKISSNQGMEYIHNRHNEPTKIVQWSDLCCFGSFFSFAFNISLCFSSKCLFKLDVGPPVLNTYNFKQMLHFALLFPSFLKNF